MDDQLFYVGLKALIQKEGKILVLDGFLGSDFPGGKIQIEETDLQSALKREVREETGLEISVGQTLTAGMFHMPQSAQSRFAGSTFFHVYYICSWISGEIQLSKEHSGYQWVDKDDFIQKVDQELERSVIAKYYALYTPLLNRYKKTKNVFPTEL